MESKSPPVSVKDRSVVGSADRGLNSTNHMPEVGGSQNRQAQYHVHTGSYELDTVFPVVLVGKLMADPL